MKKVVLKLGFYGVPLKKKDKMVTLPNIYCMQYHKESR